MAFEDILNQVVQNPTFQLGVVLGIIAIAILKFTGKLGSNVKIISRPEIIKKKMIKILEMNKSKVQILRQKDNVIGMMSNIGFYDISGKKLYLFLFSPKWFWIFPKFWVSDVMMVSEEYIQFKDYEEEKRLLGMKIGTQLFKSWVLSDDYFIDDYFMFKMNLGDSSAMDFVKMKLTLDESEVSSGAYLAQAMRLSSVDYSKAFEPTEADIQEERLNQGGKQ